MQFLFAAQSGTTTASWSDVPPFLKMKVLLLLQVNVVTNSSNKFLLCGPVSRPHLVIADDKLRVIVAMK